MVFIPPCVLCLALYLYYLLFSRDARAFTFQKLFLLLYQYGFDTLFQQKVELFWVIAQIFVEDRIDTCSINIHLKLLSVCSVK